MELVVGLFVALVGLAFAWLVVVVILWLHRPTREIAATTLRALPDVVRSLRRLVTAAGTPRSVRIAVAFLALWLAMPIDLVPDVLPVIGLLDDVIVTLLVLRFIGRRVGPDAIRAAWTGRAEDRWVLDRLLGSGGLAS